MTLVAQITALAERVAGQFNAISGRLTPTGGSNGQVVTKTASGFDWKTPLADFPVLVVNRNAIATANGFQQITAAFTTIQISDVLVDTHSGWDAANFVYTVPQTGLYDISGNLRLADNATSNVSLGVGVDVVNADSPGFVWDQSYNYPSAGLSGNTRQVLDIARTLPLTAGQQVRLFGYWDHSTPINVWSGELVVRRIR